MAEQQQSAPRAPVAPEEPKANLASNILAIVGFIILIVVVIWGLVNLASLSRGWFSSLFGKNETAIAVTAPESADSGTPFTLSWKYGEPAEGTYALLYQCASGLLFQTQGPAGAVGIPCGAAFTVDGEKKSVSLTPYLSATEARDVSLTVVFTPAATGTGAQGSAIVRVSPVVAAPAASAVETASPEDAAAPAPAPVPAPAPATPADLSVRIVSVSADAYGNGVATFEIKNVGGSPSGAYHFNANLPTASGYAYASPAQSPLASGARVANTLRFSQAVSGIFSVSITTPDGNASNNYASQTMSAPYYNSYNPYNPAYPYGAAHQYQYSYYYAYPYQYQTHYQYPYSYQYYSPQYYSTYYPYSY